MGEKEVGFTGIPDQENLSVSHDTEVHEANQTTPKKCFLSVVKGVQENFLYIVVTWLFKIFSSVFLVQYGFGNKFGIYFAINVLFIGICGLTLIIAAPISLIQNCCNGKGCCLSNRVLIYARLLGICSSILNITFIEFYIACAEDGYVMTDDYVSTTPNRNITVGTLYSYRNHHTLKCTDYATWGTFLSLLLDFSMIMKGLLNFLGMRKSAYIILFGIPILLFWSIPLAIDVTFIFLSCGNWGLMPLTKNVIAYIDETLTNADDDWI